MAKSSKSAKCRSIESIANYSLRKLNKSVVIESTKKDEKKRSHSEKIVEESELPYEPINEKLKHKDYFTAKKLRKDFISSCDEKTINLEFKLSEYQSCLKELPKIEFSEKTFHV